MVQDMVEVMEQLGHRQFFLAGHDRGGRTSHKTN
jgi:pimeloyl-ACP methyl ester carboxylesterase